MDDEPYGGEPPFEKSSDTSKTAAARIASGADTLRQQVFNLIEEHGNLTCDEIEELTGMKHQTASARLRELVLRQRIKDTGARRKTRSDRPAAVYTIITQREQEASGDDPEGDSRPASTL